MPLVLLLHTALFCVFAVFILFFLTPEEITRTTSSEALSNFVALGGLQTSFKRIETRSNSSSEGVQALFSASEPFVDLGDEEVSGVLERDRLRLELSHAHLVEVFEVALEMDAVEEPSDERAVTIRVLVERVFALGALLRGLDILQTLLKSDDSSEKFLRGWWCFKKPSHRMVLAPEGRALLMLKLQTHVNLSLQGREPFIAGPATATRRCLGGRFHSFGGQRGCTLPEPPVVAEVGRLPVSTQRSAGLR